MSKVADHQVNPIKNDKPCIQDLVIADIEARKQVGIERYGTVLQAFNGRSAILDSYQEVTDLAVYLRQVLEEEQNPSEALQKALDRGWFAGILDGEGCLSVNINKGGSVQMSLLIINTDRKMLEKIVEITGCGTIYTKKQQFGKRVTYHWYASLEDATKLLRTVLPILTTKKAQAVAWLELHELRLQRKTGEPTTEKERKLAKLIQALKHNETPNN